MSYLSQLNRQRNRRAVVAIAIALVILALSAALGCLGFLAWRAQPTLARALLFGVPPLLLVWLGLVTGAEAFLPPDRGPDDRSGPP